jgi:hypothetical protein
MQVSLATAVEIWHRYNSYLSGVSGISRQYPNATFEQFLSACGHQHGGWAKEALRNAWNAGRA